MTILCWYAILTLTAALIFSQRLNFCQATCGCKASSSNTMRHQQSPLPTDLTVTTTNATATEASSTDPIGALIDGNVRIIEGDIMISTRQPGGYQQDDDLAQREASASSSGGRSIFWPNGTLYYSLSADYTASEANSIASSLMELQLYVGSAVKFQRVSAGEVPDYVAVFNGQGCSSFVGRQTGVQPLSLQRGVCLQRYIIQHEFIHALGYWHEQSRSDRDQSVIIWWANIDFARCDNFGIYWAPPVAAGYPAYDTSSIMHYDSMAFSCNSRSATITTKNSGFIPYPIKLTKSDMLRIQYFYGFGDNTTISLTSNEGALATKSSSAAAVLFALSWVLIVARL